jgi:capsular exopolysaccharide synthesis family protein
MSMATLELPRQAAPAEVPFATTNIFLAALRRWPLLVLGLVVGLGAGFLMYSVQAPRYQSNAQIAIYKKAVRNSSGEVRMGVFEDYISAQIDTIRSQKILGAASQSKALNILTTPLPPDRFMGSEALKGGFTVTRSKETSGGGIAISPVINLSYTGKDPQDTKIILQVVIETYVKELATAYTDEARAKLTENENATERAIISKKQFQNEYNSKSIERGEITPEAEESLSRRISADFELMRKLELDIVNYKRKLELIAKTGPDKEERLRRLDELNIPRRPNSSDSPNDPEVQMQLLKAKKSQAAERGLGKDHEIIKGIDSEIAFWTARQAILNPRSKSGEVDVLASAQSYFMSELEAAETNRVIIVARHAEDVDKHKRSNKLSVEILQLRLKIEGLDKEILQLERENFSIKSNETIGGFNAQQLIEPQAGVKVAPVLLQWLALGGVLGIMMGFGLSMLVELSDKSFRTPAEIRQRLGVPVIGHIPAIRLELPSEADVPEAYSNTLVAARRPKSIEAEAYRGVRTQLSVITQNSGHQVIQVTSPNPGDGKSTLAANLAISLAQSGKKTILLDCDFRKPRVHKLFAITKPELGLASVTGGLANLTQAIRHSSIDNLDILPCGPRPQNPAELLSGARFQQVLADLRKQYDYVIVDTPPMLAVSDPRVVAQRVDGILLVFKITKRARPLAERAREQLADMGANLLGVIVNGGGKQGGDEYGYSYGYNYAYSYEYEYAETYVDTEADLDPNGSGKIIL